MRLRRSPNGRGFPRNSAEKAADGAGAARRGTERRRQHSSQNPGPRQGRPGVSSPRKTSHVSVSGPLCARHLQAARRRAWHHLSPDARHSRLAENWQTLRLEQRARSRHSWGGADTRSGWGHRPPGACALTDHRQRSPVLAPATGPGLGPQKQLPCWLGHGQRGAARPPTHQAPPCWRDSSAPHPTGPQRRPGKALGHCQPAAGPVMADADESRGPRTGQLRSGQPFPPGRPRLQRRSGARRTAPAPPPRVHGSYCHGAVCRFLLAFRQFFPLDLFLHTFSTPSFSYEI